MEAILIGNKYYERVAMPIISNERWEQYLTLIKDSIENDSPLRFTTYAGGYEHHVSGKCYLFNESLRTILVNGIIVRDQEIIEIKRLED
ncbi:YolD-like family protein [Listeria farberi]|uniref:YolD-like family protein n=1 Tax=Listeria farberi TaxID=2713500 RepID=A0A7X0ZKE9_9LIST|nr:YolD-like family protein [Listeria farberi]MBC2288853.1 YolD-like family protein [Listeria farberi]